IHSIIWAIALNRLNCYGLKITINAAGAKHAGIHCKNHRLYNIGRLFHAGAHNDLLHLAAESAWSGNQL
ncbi:MAG: hypothetical protein IJD04_06540, partial [Desulfovibrionaceae bacterium]|nr:hypothetical protein [Desulfovibrionaceae bacterium]